MIILIDIPDKDIPQRQDMLEVDIMFCYGHISQCTYPFEILKQEPNEVLQEIRQEITNLVKTYPFINHKDAYVKEEEVLDIIDRYLDKSK